MPGAGQPTPPPYNEDDWRNETIDPPESAHPDFPTTKPERIVELDPVAHKDAKGSLIDQLKRMREEVVTATEHEKERHHVRDTNPGAPATELRGLNQIRDVYVPPGETFTPSEPGMYRVHFASGSAEMKDRDDELQVEPRTMAEIQDRLADHHPAGAAVQEWRLKSQQPTEFERDLTSLLNRYSIDAAVNVPDFILAHYLNNVIKNLAGLTYSNRKWSEQ